MSYRNTLRSRVVDACCYWLDEAYATLLAILLLCVFTAVHVTLVVLGALLWAWAVA